MTTEPTSLAPPQKEGRGNTRRLATASVICGVVGLCTGGMGALIGLVLGIIALLRSSGSETRRKDRRLAATGIAVSAVCLAITVLLIVTAWWLFRLAQESSCSCTLQQLAKGVIGDANRRGGRLPPVDTWDKESIENGHTTEYSLQDPAEAGPGRCYAMNRFLSGKSLSDIRFRDRTVLLFDCIPGSPPAGGPELLLARPRHPDGHGIAFCDGHVEFVPKRKLGELIWDPNREPSPVK